MRKPRGAREHVDKAREHKHRKHPQTHDRRSSRREKAPAGQVHHGVPRAEPGIRRKQQHKIQRHAAQRHLPEPRAAAVFADKAYAAQPFAQRAPARRVLDQDKVDQHARDVDCGDALRAAQPQQAGKRHRNERAQRPVDPRGDRRAHDRHALAALVGLLVEPFLRGQNLHRQRRDQIAQHRAQRVCDQIVHVEEPVRARVDKQ